MNRSFVNWQCPLWTSTEMTRKHLSIPLGAFIQPVWEEDGLLRVRYQDASGKIHDGYIETRFAEEYCRTLPFGHVDLSDIETPDENDFAQYAIWEGVKQTNLCGQVCAAKILDLKLSDVLSRWKAKDLPFYKRIFRTGKARGTNADELVELFGEFDHKAEKITQKKYTPTLFAELARKYPMICSVKMNANNGELRGGSVLHWVVLLDVILERKMMGWVLVYNPA